MDKEAQKDFLLYAQGLTGPRWSMSEAIDKAQALSMIQIDSIRVTGLRNHEIVWAARADAPIKDLYKLFYEKRGMIETHYPLFATRREWLPRFLKGFDGFITRKETHRALKPLMRQILQRIRDEGPLSPASFDAERIPGGFNTIKASTKALEYLYCEGKIQIAGRTKDFHRLFDLTERVAPEILQAPKMNASARAEFFIRSALDVLKIATARQWQERIAHHWNPRGGMDDAKKMLGAFLKNLPDDIMKVGEDCYFYKSDYDAWSSAIPTGKDEPRFIAPLDNLLFNRKRFHALFDTHYKFEAYTPLKQRQFYYALPILYDRHIAGFIDPKKRGDEWYIDGLLLNRSIPKDQLRMAIHRFARLAECDRITLNSKIDSGLIRSLKGKIS